MRKKVFYGIVLSLVLVDTLLLGFGTQQKMLTSKTWYVGPSREFIRIQEAINSENVSNGDIIYVDWQATPYYENVTVNKSLTLMVYETYRILGKYPVVDGGNSKGAVFNVAVDGVEINGFIIRNGKYGILLTSSSNNILNNTVDSNIYGIFIDEKSANNTLRTNKIAGNGWNFGVAQYSRWNETLPLNHFIQHINQSNTVDGKPIYYLINRLSGQIPYDAGYLAIVNSTGITAENLLHLQPNYQGILVAYSSQIIVKNCKCLFTSTDLQYGITFINVTDSIIQNVTFSDISHCILLEESRNNLIQDNKIFSTSTYRNCDFGIDLEFSNNNIVNDNLVETYYDSLGIYLMDCLNNSIIANNITRTYQAILIEKSNGSIIFHNNFLDEWPQAKVSYDSFGNRFDNGYEGNYWSTYAGSDDDGDGIGDTPYPISGSNKDNYPLIVPWSEYTPVKRPVTGCYEKDIQKLYVFTNSTLGRFNFNGTEITFKVTSGYSGFLNITIPRNWIDGPFKVWINETQLVNVQKDQNATHSWIYITYDFGRYIVKIQGTEIGSIAGDLNGDGYVNAKDAIIIGRNFGGHINTP